MLHEIRVCLAGRAAEHLLLGPERASAGGAEGDLENATRHATRLFGTAGHSPDISSDEAASSNLGVVIGSPSSSESARIECLVRRFIQAEFLQVLALLRESGPLLERIVDALLRQGVLFAAELEALEFPNQENRC